MKFLLVLHLLAGDPITAQVDEKVCRVAAETFRAGHNLEIFDENGNTPDIVDVECVPVCDGNCV